jgi:hypothetical protein
MTAANLSVLDPHKPYLLREFGQGDDAWQLVRAGSTIVSTSAGEDSLGRTR